MKTYKRLTLLTFMAFVAVTLWRVFVPLNERADHLKWTTYSKEEGSLKAAPTTPEEAKNLKLPPAKDVRPRGPASLAPTPKAVEITGEGIERFEQNKAAFRFLNQVDSKWQEQMAERLLRFQDQETKMYTKHEKSLIHLEGETAKYLEQVVITFAMDDGGQYSYRALVNSEDGKIIETWDRTKHDTPYRFKRNRGGLTPTGSL